VRPFDSFPAFYGNRRFIAKFTRALHLSQSWARPMQSIPPRHTYAYIFNKWRREKNNQTMKERKKERKEKETKATEVDNF
jgi:hypothetical protein